MINLSKILFISLILIVSNFTSVFAASSDCNPPTNSRIDQFELKTYLRIKGCPNDNAAGVQNEAYFDDQNNSPIISFILSTITFLTKIAGSIAFLIIVAAGGMMVFGAEEQINKAKTMMSSAVIGLVLMFSSYIIVIFIQSIFF